MPGRRVRGGRTRTRRNPLYVLLALLSAVALALLAALLLLTARRLMPEETAPPEEEPETVTVGGQEVAIDENLAPSELEEGHFTTQADGSITYSGQASYGIDVSAHQGEIDWVAVADSGVEFAMLRIGNRGYTSGAISQDERFEENFQAARENGIQLGVYFFSQAISEEEAREEAGQVLAWLDGRSLECPVAYDWEHITDDVARTDGLDGETVTDCAIAFCQTIAEAGYTPFVYCNGMLGYLSYDVERLQDYGLWYAEYADYPSFAYELEMWQYTDEGTVAGISGPVDRNIWLLDSAADAAQTEDDADGAGS